MLKKYLIKNFKIKLVPELEHFEIKQNFRLYEQRKRK